MRFDFLDHRSSRVAAALALVTALAVGLGTMRWTLPTGWSEDKLRQALARTTGYGVERIGQAQMSALPWPTIHVSGLVLTRPGEGGERIEASLVKARLNAYSWLFGAPRLVELALFDPSIDLAPEAGSAPNAGEAAVSSALVDLLGRDRRRDLRVLRIERGMLRLGGRPWMSNLALKLTGGVGADLTLTASGLHDGLPLEVSAEVAPVKAQERRPVRAILSSSAFTARFTGELYGPRSLDAEGQLALRIVDGSSIARRLDLPVGQVSLMDGVVASGRARVAWPTIQIRDARIERGQTRLDGSIEASLEGPRAAVAATLDAQRFDVTPALDMLSAALAEKDGGWATAPLDRRWLNAGALDLRLSASELTAGPATVEDAALSLQLGGGRMDLTLRDGRLRNGLLKGRLTLADQPDSRLEMRLQASVDRIDLGQLGPMAGIQRLRGIASGQITMRASGSSVATLLAAAEGRAEATIRDGELPGVDLERMTLRPEAAPAADRRTRFSSLGLSLQIADGMARIADGSVQTALVRAAIEGGVGIMNRSVDVTLRPAPVAPTARAGAPRVRLEGPWSSPTLSQ